MFGSTNIYRYLSVANLGSKRCPLAVFLPFVLRRQDTEDIKVFTEVFFLFLRYFVVVLKSWHGSVEGTVNISVADP